jgi:hypothetical protein
VSDVLPGPTKAGRERDVITPSRAWSPALPRPLQRVIQRPLQPNPRGRAPSVSPLPPGRRRFAGMFEAGCAYMYEPGRVIVAAVESAAPFTKYTERANVTGVTGARG